MQGGHPVGFAFHQPRHAAPELVAGLPNPGEFFRDVGNDPLGGVRGRGGPKVGDVVEDGPVRLMADRADHRCGRAGHCPDQVLVAEGEQVLQSAAAAGDDDDVNVRDPHRVRAARQ